MSGVARRTRQISPAIKMPSAGRGAGGWGVQRRDNKGLNPGMIRAMSFKPIQVVVFPADGLAEVREISQDLESLQKIVGGYIEAVSTSYDDAGVPQAIFWLNEEGKLKRLRPNGRATALWWALEGGPTGDHFCGTVILSGGNDGEGDMLPVPQVFVDRLGLLNEDK